MNPDSDDLDALTLIDDGALNAFGIPYYDPAADTLLFSVRRGSAVIGIPDSAFGVPIEEGDILKPPAAPGLPPEIFIAAEALGLTTVRSGTALSHGVINPKYFADLWADDLDALDMEDDRPQFPQPPGQKVLTPLNALSSTSQFVVYAGLAMVPAQTPIFYCHPGDFNCNGTVDASDYVLWRKTDGSPSGYNTWRANFGATPGSGASLGSSSGPSVPESATSVALLTAVVGILIRRHRSSQ